MEFLDYQTLKIEIIGLLGAILILIGFYRTSIGKWQTNSFWYELDNLIGSLLLAVYHVLNKTYVALILNVVWSVVAFKGITAYRERRKVSKRVKR